jgi:hypothetical protein
MLVVEDDQVRRVDFVATTPSRFYAPVALGIWVANWETGCAALGIEGRWSFSPDRGPGREPGTTGRAGCASLDKVTP